MQIIYLLICYLFVIIFLLFLLHLRMLRYTSTRTLTIHVVGTVHYTCTHVAIYIFGIALVMRNSLISFRM